MINMINKIISKIYVLFARVAFLWYYILKILFHLLIVIFQLLILLFLFLWIPLKWRLLCFKRFIIIINTFMLYRIRRNLFRISSSSNIGFITFSTISLIRSVILEVRLLDKILWFSYYTPVWILLLLLLLNCFDFIIFC